MDLTFITGIVISIILAYWGIWHSQKDKSKIELSLIDRNWIPLISTYQTPLESLKLLNYQFPFDANQYYYRGTFVNTGNVDIYKNNILKPLKISFDDEIKILNFRLLSSNSDLDISSIIANDSVIIEWDLLKPCEKFSFEIIMESAESKPIWELEKYMKLESRIADLKSINRFHFSDLSNVKMKFSEYLLTYIFLFVILGSSFIYLLNGINSFYHDSGLVSYSIVSKYTNEPVELKFYSADSILIKSENKDEIIAKNFANNQIQLSIKVEVNNNRQWIVVGSFLFIVVILFGIVFKIKDHLRDIRFNQIVKSLE